MSHLIPSLLFVTSIASTLVSAVPSRSRPAPTADLKFTCPHTLPKSLCCSNDIQGNGAVVGCQESVFILPNNDPNVNLTTLGDRCTTSQLTAGYDSPACCKTQVRTFKFEDGAPIYLGVNCMEPDDVSVSLERRNLDEGIEKESKTTTRDLDMEKLAEILAHDESKPVVPRTVSHSLFLHEATTIPNSRNSAQKSEESLVPAARSGSTKRAARPVRKQAFDSSKVAGGLADTMLKDLNSASSRSVLRSAAAVRNLKTRNSAGHHVARIVGLPGSTRIERQVGTSKTSAAKPLKSKSPVTPKSRSTSGLSSALNNLLGLSSGSSGKPTSKLGGLMRRRAAAIVAQIQ